MRPPPLRVVNVGGSLTTALVLSAVAWGVRLLRAKNILRPAERPTKPAARASSKTLYGRLSPLTFRLLVRLVSPRRALVAHSSRAAGAGAGSLCADRRAERGGGQRPAAGLPAWLVSRHCGAPAWCVRVQTRRRAHAPHVPAPCRSGAAHGIASSCRCVGAAVRQACAWCAPNARLPVRQRPGGCALRVHRRQPGLLALLRAGGRSGRAGRRRCKPRAPLRVRQQVSRHISGVA